MHMSNRQSEKHNSDKNTNWQNKIWQEKKDAEQFLKTIAPKYLGVYVVDSKTDRFRDIIGPSYFRKIVEEKDGCFSDAMKEYCEKIAAPEYRDMLINLLDYEHINQIVRDKGKLERYYRKKDNTLIKLIVKAYSNESDNENLSLWIFMNEYSEEVRFAGIGEGRWSMDFVDEKLVDIRWNDVSKKEFGYADNGDEMFDTECRSFSYIHPDDRERFIKALSNVLNQKDDGNIVKLDLEQRMLFKDGSYKWYRIIGRPFRNDAGVIYRISGLFVDVDEHKNNEINRHAKLIKQKEMLEKQQLELEKTSKAKTNFLRRMSHDIRTPINGIRGIVEIASHCPEDFERQEMYRDKIMTASGYLLELLTGILDMSKLESGEVKLEHKPFNILAVLEEANNVAIMQGSEKGITYKIGNGEIFHPDLIGSPIHFQQIVMNIASNAVKFNRVGGTIMVSCNEVSYDDTMAHFELVCEDTGCGISEEFQKKMFEPFAKENTDVKSDYDGTGLGLPMAKELAELLGGYITFESKVNVGTKFVIHLPFEIDRDTQKRKMNEIPEDISIEGIRILLAEDNELNMEIADCLLTERGALITRAWNGKEAVDIYRSLGAGAFDVIIMDIMMPVMDGIEAARTIRSSGMEDSSSIPIIAMSANAFQDDIEQSMNAGMNEHITKPIDLKRLINTIHSLVKKKNLI